MCLDASVASGQNPSGQTSIWAIPCGQMSMWANSMWANVHLDKFHVGKPSWAKHIFVCFVVCEWRETSWVWSWHYVLELTDILQTVICCQQLFVIKSSVGAVEHPVLERLIQWLHCTYIMYVNGQLIHPAIWSLLRASHLIPRKWHFRDQMTRQNRIRWLAKLLIRCC